jgi:hypothetical protein
MRSIYLLPPFYTAETFPHCYQLIKWAFSGASAHAIRAMLVENFSDSEYVIERFLMAAMRASVKTLSPEAPCTYFNGGNFTAFPSARAQMKISQRMKNK